MTGAPVILCSIIMREAVLQLVSGPTAITRRVISSETVLGILGR